MAVQACFRAGRVERVKTLSKSLVLAVDLGFAEEAPSTGIAWRSETGEVGSRSATFSEAVAISAEKIWSNAGSPSALVIDAPLSCFFGPKGNPVGRDFERPAEGKGAGRYWYVHAGAVTCLAALFFVRRLGESLQSAQAEVHVYEGFVTFKAKRSRHETDAEFLVTEFLSERVDAVIPASGITAESLLNVAGFESTASELPAIVGVGANRTCSP